MSVCTFFLRPSENQPNLQELKNKMATGSIEERIEAVKDLVRCMSNDESYPPIIMHIITNIIPQQHKSHELRKVMLLYWEIIQKSKSPTDKSLKEEVFLACNSLRNDLISFNEFVRGRTLRLVSRIMHKGVIEPLAGAITSNLTHTSNYVRRNAVICLYNIHMHFGSDIIGEIDDEVQTLLKTETDLSTKRNAFLLLNKTNPPKAMEYLEQQIKNQSVEEIGDILQLAILKILKQKCREDPSQKARLLRIVQDFQEKGTDSVRLQCAITGTAISNSASTIRGSLNTYVSILSRTSEINVNKIILDKLQIICKNSNYLQDDVVEDLLKGLHTPSLEIKIKIIDIVMTSLSSKSSQIIIHQLAKENIPEQPELISKILSLLELISHKYTVMHSEVSHFVQNQILNIPKLDTSAILSLSNTCKLILQQKNQSSQEFINILIQSLNLIPSAETLNIVLNELSTYLNQNSSIQAALDNLHKSIGGLPFSLNEEEDTNTERHNGLRYHLIHNSILGGVFARSIAKLLYKIRKTTSFNKYACHVLKILCSLLRTYQENVSFVDQAIIDQITVIVRRIVNPQGFINREDPLFTTQTLPVTNFTFNNKKVEMIEKNPEDLVHFRLLKKGQQASQFDYDEEQVNDILEQTSQRVDYVTKLKSVVQLTGTFDPLYAEAFVNVNKYDLFFQILLVNNTKMNLLNIQLEFSSNVEVIVLEKAQCVNLRPFESVMLRTQLRFSSCQFGIVYGYINYDNQAGLEQPYLITEEIRIDYMQYISPESISSTAFKIQWEKAGNQASYQTSIPLKEGRNFHTIIKAYQKVLHAKLVQNIDSKENRYFLNCHLFGTSKLGDNFYVNMSLFAGDQINLSIMIRSKDKAVKDIIFKELTQKKLDLDEEQ